MVETLHDVVARVATTPGVTRTRVPRQSIVRYDEARSHVDMDYEPMLCIVTSGSKIPDDGTHAAVGAGDVLFASIVAPVVASFAPPYRSVTLTVDLDRVAAIDRDVPRARDDGSRAPAVLVAAASDDLLDAFARWVRLADAPQEIAVLAPRYEDEILFRVLLSPIGPALRRAAAVGSDPAIRRAVQLIQDGHADRSLTAGSLARSVGMSTSAFFARFRARTGLTPHRYIKRMRLRHARALLDAGATATQASAAVGYLSPAHFSRDYAAQYGASPRRHTRMLAAARTGGTPPPTGA